MKEKVSRLLTNFFVNRMISDPKNIENPSVRKAYGTLSSVVCMVCNILLFSIKYLAGSLSGSIAILSDAFNNLSDCANCLITFFGYRMAAKPADNGQNGIFDFPADCCAHRHYGRGTAAGFVR